MPSIDELLAQIKATGDTELLEMAQDKLASVQKKLEQKRDAEAKARFESEMAEKRIKAEAEIPTLLKRLGVTIPANGVTITVSTDTEGNAVCALSLGIRKAAGRKAGSKNGAVRSSLVNVTGWLMADGTVLETFSAVCKAKGITVGADSAKRVLEKWVRQNADKVDFKAVLPDGRQVSPAEAFKMAPAAAQTPAPAPAQPVKTPVGAKS